MVKNDGSGVELSEEELNKAFSVATIAWCIQEIGFRGLKQRIGPLLKRLGVTSENPVTRANLAKLVLEGIALARKVMEEELAEAEKEVKKKKGKPE